MGINGVDVAGLRPFDLVIPFTIQKGEITGSRGSKRWLPAVCLSPAGRLTLCSCHREGEVRMPSGKVAKPDITDNKDGTVTVKYAPTEAGLHEMDIKYDGLHIPGTTALQLPEDGSPTRHWLSVQSNLSCCCVSLSSPPSRSAGSPLQFYVDYMNSGNVSAYGPGLIHGTVNKPAVFTVNTKDAGEGMHPHLIAAYAVFLSRFLSFGFFHH